MDWFKSIMDEFEKHRDIYSLAEIKCVFALISTPKEDDEHWHNFGTLITLLPSGDLKPWEKLVNRDNFVILSAVIDLDQFKKILEEMVRESILNVNGYPAVIQNIFTPMELIDSQKAEQSYNVEWSVNLWCTVKDGYCLPPEGSLQLESDKIPFRYSGEAIQYHLNLTHESWDAIHNSVNILAPLSYAKIVEAELREKKLRIKIRCNYTRIQELSIKYITEGSDSRSSYFKFQEAKVIHPDSDLVCIDLSHSAAIVTVWLTHLKGFVIDSRKIWRIPSQSIETIENDLLKDSAHLTDEAAGIITDNIVLCSKEVLSFATTDYLVDSLDVEVLKAVRTVGGDYDKFIPEVLKFLSLEILLSRLGRLRTIGFIDLKPPRKILLTSLGMDAVYLPPVVLSARVPLEVGNRLAEIRSAFRDGDYYEVSNKSTRILEAIIRERLEGKFQKDLEMVWGGLRTRDYDRATLGDLKNACLALKVIRKDDLSDHILSMMLKLRIPMSHEKDEVSTPQNIASITLRLVEAFIRVWYY